MADNLPPNNNLRGGGVGSSSNLVNKHGLAKAVPDTSDSSTYYDAAAEKEAEELALVLDAARGNVADDEGAEENVKVKRRREVQERRNVGGRKEYTPAGCQKCQEGWEMYQTCLCDRKSLDGCVQGKRQNYVSGSNLQMKE